MAEMTYPADIQAIGLSSSLTGYYKANGERVAPANPCSFAINIIDWEAIRLEYNALITAIYNENISNGGYGNKVVVRTLNGAVYSIVDNAGNLVLAKPGEINAYMADAMRWYTPSNVSSITYGVDYSAYLTGAEVTSQYATSSATSSYIYMGPYTGTLTVNQFDGDGFEIVFPDGVLNGYGAMVYYKTTLTNPSVLPEKISNTIEVSGNDFNEDSTASKTLSGGGSATGRLGTAGNIVLHKRDSVNDAKIKDATFTLTKDGDTVNVLTATTNVSGELDLNLESIGSWRDQTNNYAGTYTLTEVDTPKGYVKMDPNPVTITLNSIGEITDITSSNYVSLYNGSKFTLLVKNDPTGGFEVTKIDPDIPDSTLADAEFILYYEDGGKTYYYAGKDTSGAAQWTTVSGDAMLLTTGAAGKLAVDGLEYRTYTLEETAAPEDYSLPSGDDCKTQIVIDSSEIVKITVENTKTNVTPDPVYVALQGEKKLSGRNLKTGEFSFILRDESGNLVYTTSNGADRKFVFEELEFTAEGSYYYTVEEDATGSLGGIEYDTTVYAVEIIVTADSSGNLTTETIYKVAGKEVQEIVFNNSYQATGSLILKAEKKLTGRDLGAQEFSFIVVEDSTGKIIRTANNTAGDAGGIGIVTFAAINYDETDIGNTYTYSVKENAGSSNGITYDDTVYTVTVKVADKGDGTLDINTTYEADGSSADAITFENRYDVVDVRGTKTWDDASDQDGKRPPSIVVHLLADGNIIDRKTVTASVPASDNWAYQWTSLPRYKDGREIIYTVDEDVVNGYTKKISGYNITNTHTPETIDISGTKIWNDADDQDGNRPDKITVRLYANKVEVDSKTVTEDASGNWEYEWTGLAKYADGEEITYTVDEDVVSGYTKTVSGYDITNSYTPGETTRTVKKEWNDSDNQDGKRPEDIEVQLYANGAEKGDPVTLDTSNGWSYTWDNLPEKNSGTDIEYSVREVSVPADYTVSYGGTDGFTITNTHTPETIDISGTKIWKDADNQDGNRPDNITVRLYADNEEIDSKPVTKDANGNWEYEWTGLAKYADGEEIIYTVDEDVVSGYTKTVSGYDITNSYTPGETSRTVRKVWDDKNDKAGKRPSDITVQLYADGTAKGSPVALNDTNNWSYTWTGLPEKSSGTVIDYTVKETGIPADYTVTYSQDGFTITNRYRTTEAVIDVEKVLLGRDLKAGEFRFELWEDETDTLLATVSNDGDGGAAFPKITYDKAGTYIYTVNEKKESLRRIVYDESIYTVKVTVAEVDDELKATVTYTKDGEEQDSILFTNKYKPIVMDETYYNDLEVKKSVDKTETKPGEKITYTISATNSGDVEKDDLVIKDYLPEYTSFESSPDGTLVEDDGKAYVKWTIDSLAPGETVEFTFTVKVSKDAPNGHKIENTAIYGNNKTTNTVTTKVKNVQGTGDTTPAKKPGTTTRTTLKTSGTSKTGDTTPWVFWILCAAAAAGGVLILVRRRRSNSR